MICWDSKRSRVSNLYTKTKGALYIILGIVLMESCYFLFFNFFTDSKDDNHLEMTHQSHEIALKPFKLIDVEKAEQIVVPGNDKFVLKTQLNCNQFNCFDVYRCNPHSNTPSVYLYPIRKFLDSDKKKPISSHFTAEFYQLLKDIQGSSYFVSDPSKACVFIPTIDTLSESYIDSKGVSRALASLPFWNEGRNHLIFNMLPGSSQNHSSRLGVETGKAMVAGGGFNSWSFRSHFDISIPVFSPLSKENLHRSQEELQDIIKSKRSQMIIGLQSDLIDPELGAILEELEVKHHEKLFLFEKNCIPAGEDHSLRCNSLRSLRLRYTDLLQSSDFCLIMATSRLGSHILSDSLMLGCIPVIVIDDYVLPFHQKIDWTAVSIRIHQQSLSSLVDILSSIDPERLLAMREQAFFIWREYFSSMETIFDSTMKIITERISPQFSLSRSSWNRPKSSGTSHLLPLVNPKLLSRSLQGFTAVILTYDRFESLCQVIYSVSKSPSCVKIVIVWNNQAKKPPPHNEWPKVDVPIKVIITKENRLSNRFFPYNDITTDAILAIDDDIAMLTGDELEFGYQVWREFSDVIVGFPSRVHRWDNQTNEWKYESEWTNDLSMILTGAAFYHKYYNYLYFFMMDRSIFEIVDKNMNCEDIAMNFLVSNVTGKAPVKVLPRKKFRCPECVNSVTLSNDVINHLNARSSCINQFASIYGCMPLKSVEFRADPVLFKDNLPEKLKKFYRFGEL